MANAGRHVRLVLERAVSTGSTTGGHPTDEQVPLAEGRRTGETGLEPVDLVLRTDPDAAYVT